jgi:hypothetical protein
MGIVTIYSRLDARLPYFGPFEKGGGAMKAVVSRVVGLSIH